jgi:hypothetical protein
MRPPRRRPRRRPRLRRLPRLRRPLRRPRRWRSPCPNVPPRLSKPPEPGSCDRRRGRASPVPLSTVPLSPGPVSPGPVSPGPVSPGPRAARSRCAASPVSHAREPRRVPGSRPCPASRCRPRRPVCRSRRAGGWSTTCPRRAVASASSRRPSGRPRRPVTGDSSPPPALRGAVAPVVVPEVVPVVDLGAAPAVPAAQGPAPRVDLAPPSARPVVPAHRVLPVVDPPAALVVLAGLRAPPGRAVPAVRRVAARARRARSARSRRSRSSSRPTRRRACGDRAPSRLRPAVPWTSCPASPSASSPS